MRGTGISQALEGVEVVLHLATGKGDVQAARTLFTAARDVGVTHLVLISIVGIDTIPLGYYRGKVEIERLLVESGVPHTILRSTQFHNLIDTMFSVQRFWPVLFAPSLSFQSIDVGEVGGRLVELAGGAPAGRVTDIGGPELRTGRELAAQWAAATGSRRRIAPLRLPGRTFAAYATGDNMVPGKPYGRGTFGDYLEAKYSWT